MKSDRIAYQFQKNSRETVCAVLKEWGGRHLVDFRVYYRGRPEDVPKPGNKGLCIRVELLSEMKRALAEIDKAMASEPS